MIPETEPTATPELLGSIHEERILGKFSRAGCRRLTGGVAISLVTKTEGCSEEPLVGVL